ncbi:MAG: glutamine-hydrolyzing GMP synthase [Nanoarchaeota archaeon]|nr:glutamine-hydrolyzing GMP synthase [Nanoarchaeota archaeon]
MLLVVNFGGQTCHLIARRVRSLGVYSEIVPYDISIEKIKELKPCGLILSGGPSSVYEKGSPLPDMRIFDLGIPVLGICYGHQLIGKRFGKVAAKEIKEFGKANIDIQKHCKLFKGLNKKELVWMSHGDQVVELPDDFTVLASTPSCKIAAFESEKYFGVQFHPEVTHTVNGIKILENFIGICKCPKDYSIKGLASQLIKEVKYEVGTDDVIMGFSGGVDSTVAAALIHQAIGDHIHCVFIDHGLIRKDEMEEVKGFFTKFKFKNHYIVDASRLFLDKLEGVTDPEKKRKIIGHTFIEAFENKVKELEKKHPNIKFLGQGTIYPDRIESAQPSKSASKIKSHHNLTLPEKMKLRVIEPLKDLYKDGVRELGKELGIPADILGRHPFPGPGLAIRILGEVTDERLRILREADHIFISELRSSGLYDKTWQAFAALFPVKSVGVMGDARTYEYVISLRAVSSTDAMTADWTKFPDEFLENVSNRIINEVKGVNRVVYDITQKPPGTIEYE